MSNIIYLDDLNIPELDLYVGNREVKLLRYFEPEPGIFIAESRNVIELAMNQGYEPISMVCTEGRLTDSVVERMGERPVYVVDADAAKKHFEYVLTGGISCAMRRKANPSYMDVLKDAERVLVLENVENPTNVGAMFRTAAALGVDAVILSPSCADPLYRRAMRVSVGNTLLIPWSYIGRNDGEWQEKGIEILKTEGFKTVAMALREDNVNVDDPLLKAAKKLAMVMGNEGDGLTEDTIDKCDHVAKIPMREGVDSLNVGAAAAIAMWELGKR